MLKNTTLKIFITLIITSASFTSPIYAASGQLPIPQSVTEPISPTPYVKVYVKRFSIPSNINVTDVSGYLTLTSGLPYIAQGAFAVLYNSSGTCPADGSIHSDYLNIWNGSNIPIFWMNTILSKPGFIQVPTVFHFPVKRSISGCGFMTFDMASYPNAALPSSGLTLSSNVTLHYDIGTAVSPQPYQVAVGSEVCYGTDQGCHKATTCTSSTCAFMNVTKITTPTYLWSLFGDANTGVFTGAPYGNSPTGVWSASQDTYIYKNCSSLQNGLSGPSDFYSQVPNDATPLFSVPMQSSGNENIVKPVNKYFSKPILLDPGNCLVNLTRLSSADGSFMVNTATYALLQAAIIPSPDPVAGDITGDGHVNSSDYTLLKTNFGKPYTLLDYNLIATNFGK